MRVSTRDIIAALYLQTGMSFSSTVYPYIKASLHHISNGMSSHRARGKRKGSALEVGYARNVDRMQNGNAPYCTRGGTGSAGVL